MPATTPDAAVPPPVPPATPPLLRRPGDRVFRGVCAAVARSTGTDPVLWRVVLGVLVLFGGSGAVLYGAGWLLIPEEGADGSVLEQWSRGRRPPRSLLVAAAVGAFVLWLGTAGRSDTVALLAAGGLVYLVLRRPAPAALAARAELDAHTLQRAAPEPDAPGGEPYGVVPWGADQLGAGPYGELTPGWYGGPLAAPAPPEAAAPRQRSALGLLTVSAALLVTGALLGLRALGVDGVTAGRVLAADLLVVGLGLLVGARWGRARGLVLLAVPLAAALALAAAVRVPVDLSAGQRSWPAADGSDFRLGVGEAFLDLRPLEAAGAAQAATVHARLGAGHLVVQVPDGLHVELDARVTGGEVLLPGEPPRSDGPGVRVTRSYGPAGAPPVHVEVRLGAGQLEVDRVAP